jgi:dihydroxyacetone kinase-like predicted kinase
VHYDPEADSATNAAAMNAAIAGVATGEVTFAVRDTTSDIGSITAGHAIGLMRGDGVVATSPDVFECVTALLDQLVTPERELVTIITGVDADAVVTSKIVEWLSANRADAAVEVHHGGQPLYPYLFGVE